MTFFHKRIEHIFWETNCYINALSKLENSNDSTMFYLKIHRGE